MNKIWNNDRKTKRKMIDGILNGLIYGAAGLTMTILVIIIGFIVVKGIPHINLGFLVRNYEDQTQYIDVKAMKQIEGSEQQVGYLSALGVVIQERDGQIIVSKIESNSSVKAGLNRDNQKAPVKRNDVLLKVHDLNIEGQSIQEIVQYVNQINDEAIQLKIIRPGHGILPMLMSTLFMIVLTLSIAGPIGILSALYLTEYAKPGKVVRLIRFAIENLAGIPSIIYGLFGMIFFVVTLKMGYSILAGAFTLSILLLPTIIRTTEETLIAIPDYYRANSLALGATKLQTIRTVVLPNAISGIVVAVILSIGRIIGESAALLLTAGTAARIPQSFFESGATLTVKAYMVTKEEGNIGVAAAIGTVILVLVISLNLLSKLISRKLIKTGK